MSVYFISDLHLSEQQPNITALFTTFLQHYAHNAAAIYILGDFFDVWIGDDNTTDYNQAIFRLLKQTTDNNIPIYFMVGNRDFMIGDQFLQQTGCQLLTDPTVIELYGEKVLVMHGDSLCTDDKWHMRFRKVTRHPFTKRLYLSLPLSLRRRIADYCRTFSRKKNQHSNITILDANVDTIKQQLQHYKVNHLIHGHTHQPSIHRFYDGEHWNEHRVLSDWGKQGNYLVCHDDGRKTLRYFELGTPL